MFLTFCILICIVAAHSCTFTALLCKPGFINKIFSFTYVSVFIIVLIFSSCQSTTQQTANNSATDNDTSFAIINLPNPLPITQAESVKLNKACKSWYDSTLINKGFNGGMIVAKDGNIVFETYNGTAHLPGTDVITANTPLHIASISKTFTAMAILKLWQDGKLNIDDELSKYIPTFNYSGVTIRSLLNHRSGLPNYVHFLENMGWDKTKIATNQDVLNFLIEKKGQFVDVAPPNAHFSYCNTNYALLALLIEKVTGKNFPKFMHQTFFGPLQMNHTFIYDKVDSIKINPSYDWKGRLERLNFLDAVYGDKNVYTTPQDLLIWDRALRSNKIFTSETLAQAYTPYSNEKLGIKNYGLGWRMNIYPDGKKIIFHNGWWHGSNAAFVRLIKEGVTIIVIGNKFTRSIYGAKILCNLFGDYYAADEEEENESLKSVDSANALFNITAPKKISKKDAKLQDFFKDNSKVYPKSNN